MRTETIEMIREYVDESQFENIGKVDEAFGILLSQCSNHINEESLVDFLEGKKNSFNQNILINQMIETTSSKNVEELLTGIDDEGVNDVITWFNNRESVSSCEKMRERTTKIETFINVLYRTLDRKSSFFSKPDQKKFDIISYCEEMKNSLEKEAEAFSDNSEKFINGDWICSEKDSFNVSQKDKYPYLQYRNTLLVGPAGAGKTWLLKKLQYEMCRSTIKELKENGNNKDGIYVPIYIELRSYNNTSFTADSKKSILQYMIQDKLGIDSDEIDKINDCNFVLLLDGYDEIHDNNSANTSDVKKFMFSPMSKKMRCIMTSRKQESSAFPVRGNKLYISNPYSKELINDYFDQYVEKDKIDTIKKELNGGQLSWLIDNKAVYPLMIEALVNEYNNSGCDAFSKDKFDSLYLRYLLLREQDKHGRENTKDLIKIMRVLAKSVQNSNMDNQFDSEFIVDVLENEKLRSTEKKYDDYITDALYVPIIVQEKGIYRFDNENYIEYFCNDEHFEFNGEIK